MSRDVVNCESVPDFSSDFCAEEVRQWLETMDVQVVHHQMDRPGFGIPKGQLKNDLGTLEA